MNIKFPWSKGKKRALSAEEQIAREKLLSSLSEDVLGQIRGGALANCHPAVAAAVI